jgi:hypothetical protein
MKQNFVLVNTLYFMAVGINFSVECIAGIWLGVNCRHTGYYSSSIALFSFEGGTKQTVFICKFSLT